MNAKYFLLIKLPANSCTNLSMSCPGFTSRPSKYYFSKSLKSWLLRVVFMSSIITSLLANSNPTGVLLVRTYGTREGSRKCARPRSNSQLEVNQSRGPRSRFDQPRTEKC